MNKLIIFALVSLAIVAYATGVTTGRPRKNGTVGPNTRNGTFGRNGTERYSGGRKKKFTQCAREKCPNEVKALEALFEAPREQTECEKKCNPENKKFHHLSEEEVKKIRQCYVDNNCLKDKKQRFNHRNSTEFLAFKKCVDEKCPNDYKKKFKTTPLPVVSTTSK